MSGVVGQGISFWPELHWVVWPRGEALPGRFDVVRVAYRMAGLDYESEADRSLVKRSRATYKPILLMAAVPVLVRVCGCSGKEAVGVFGFSRHLVRGDALMGLLDCPACRLLTRDLIFRMTGRLSGGGR
jgi:hypothetical protein